MKFGKQIILAVFVLIALILPAKAVVVYWEPAAPIPGGTVTIYYNVQEGTLPNNANPVYIHLGINGWENVHDYKMTADTAAGWWKFTFDIPAECNVIDFVFKDLQDNWDNNGGMGIDWHISLNYSWQPQSPGANDTITITIRNSDQGGNILWYVLNNGRPAPPIAAYWPENSFYTPFRDAVESPLNGPDADGNYHLKIAPLNNPRQFVEAVKFKIHWADGSYENSLFEIETDFTPQQGDAQITFVSPDSGAAISGSATVRVTADSAQSVELWGGVDSLGRFTAAPYQAQWTPTVNNFGGMYVLAKAVNKNGRVTLARVPVSITPQVVHEGAPQGIKDGVTVNGNQVTFALYAPAKEYIALTGNFNSSFPNGELMKQSGDSLWWLSKTLDNGTYLYQYNIEGKKLLADPWSKDVRWKQPGTEEESSNYEYAQTQFTVGGNPFDWQDAGWNKPKFKDLIIYELYLRDFGGDHAGDYSDVMQKLQDGYFDSLGVNAIEFMPLNEFPGGWSWGYNPAFDLAPESAYGTPEDLRDLINELHKHNIAAILDVVYNHMEGAAPLFQLYQPKGSWNRHDHDYAHCPYFQDRDTDWFYKLQHWKYVDGRHYRTWRYVSDALQNWVQSYHFDGFRFDVSWGIGWEGYNTNGMSYYSWFLRQLDSTQYVIAEEDFYSGTNQVNVTETNANWHFRFYHQMKANLREGSDGGRSWGDMDYTAGVVNYAIQPEGPSYTDPSGMLNYTESHDQTRIIYECMNYSSPKMSREKAIKKSKLGAAVLLTDQGVPMLYHGQEFGQDGAKNGTDPQPLQWDYLNTPEGKDLFNYYRRLIWLRKNWPLLENAYLKILKKDDNTKMLVYQRQQSDEYVIVAANFDRTDHTITIGFPTDGNWFEFIGDDTVYVEHGSLSNYTVPASTAKIFTNNKNWPTAVSRKQSKAPLKFALAQNYPNPFNPETKINFTLPKAERVKIEIFNALGQRMATVVNKTLSAGEHQIIFKAQSLSSGVYFYRIEAGKFNAVRKMMLIK